MTRLSNAADGVSPFLRGLLILLWVTLSLEGQAATASAAYISDQLTVPVRSGPSGGHRIVHRGLPSGTRLEVLEIDEAAGFSRIRTQRGTQGWIRSQYLVTEPTARLRLITAEQALRQTESALADERQTVKDLTRTSERLQNANQLAADTLKELTKELEQIKTLSANALETHAKNQQLNENNARLHDELDDLSEQYTQLQENTENERLLIGAGLMLLGLLAGVLIKTRPRRSGWS